MPEISLSDLTRNGEVRNLTGHERGVAARQHFGLTALDAQDEPVDVAVPADLYTITPSFFQGMFAESVHRLGSKDAFLQRYRFHASTVFMLQIERGIAAALTRRHEVLQN